MPASAASASTVAGPSADHGVPPHPAANDASALSVRCSNPHRELLPIGHGVFQAVRTNGTLAADALRLESPRFGKKTPGVAVLAGGLLLPDVVLAVGDHLLVGALPTGTTTSPSLARARSKSSKV